MSLTSTDIYAGCGGLSLGGEWAGIKPVYAVNHWDVAVKFYELNHGVKPLCENAMMVNWSSLDSTDVLLAAPACQGHSIARGKDKPHHDTMRSTAWAVVDYLEYHKPKLLVIENVPQIRKWERFSHWIGAIESHGYSTSVNIVNAADCGVPQSRKRCFILATRSKHPITLKPFDYPHVSVDSIIDWSDSSGFEPIYGRKRKLSQTTLDMLDAGVRQHGSRFFIQYNGSLRRDKVTYSIDRPLNTVTTVERFGVYREGMFRMLTVDENRKACSFPEGFILPQRKADAIKMLGNAVPPLMAQRVIGEALRVL